MNRECLCCLCIVLCATLISLLCGIYVISLTSTKHVPSAREVKTRHVSKPVNLPRTSHRNPELDLFTEIAVKYLRKLHNSSRQSNVTRLKVGILIPSTWRGLQNNSTMFLNTSSLLHVSLPSLFKTIEPDLYSYSIYVGIDRGDFVESLLTHLKAVSKLIVPVVLNSTNFNECVNGIAARAYSDGMDYFVRTTDDMHFVKPKWTSYAIARLLSYTPPNLGVAGPRCNEGNTKILTHDMVHRTHLEIFDFYYPREFTNWWADDWITEVYKPARTSVVEEWLVIHKETHGQRYKPESFRKNRLKLINQKDKPRITEFISANKTDNSPFTTNFVKQVNVQMLEVVKSRGKRKT